MILGFAGGGPRGGASSSTFFGGAAAWLLGDARTQQDARWRDSSSVSDGSLRTDLSNGRHDVSWHSAVLLSVPAPTARR